MTKSTTRVAADVANIAGRKNLIINGAMSVWQRGTSFAGTDPATFSADRFNVAYSDTVNTMAVTRSAIVPDGFTYSMEITGSASQYPSTGVELPVTGKGGIFAKGKKFTYSLYSDNPVAPMLYVLFRDVIHGGTGSSVLILAKEMSVIESDSSNGFIRYAITFEITDVPDAGNQCLTVAPRFFNTTVDETYRVTGVQLELGSVATPFEHRSYGEELALCQRYYYEITDAGQPAYSAVLRATSGSGIQQYSQEIFLPVIMRVTPMVVITYLDMHKPGVLYDAINYVDIVPRTHSVGFRFSVANPHPQSIACQVRDFFISLDAEL